MSDLEHLIAEIEAERDTYDRAEDADFIAGLNIALHIIEREAKS